MNQIRSLELDGTIFKDNSEKVWRQKIPRLDFSSIGEEDKQRHWFGKHSSLFLKPKSFLSLVDPMEEEESLNV